MMHTLGKKNDLGLVDQNKFDFNIFDSMASFAWYQV